MTGRRLTDAQLAGALRAHLPAAARADLRGRILAEVESTPQQQPLPSFLGWLSDADPIARRRNLLIAAALLLALALTSVAAVGAWRLLQRDPVPRLDLEPPADLQAFVLSVYDRLPALSPVAITTLEDGSAKGRIYVDRSGAVRFERYATPDATEPDTYRILNGTRIGEVAVLGSSRVWIDHSDGIAEDPRVFLLVEMGRPLFPGTAGCETTRNEGDSGNGTAAKGWAYVGVEDVVGRPTHHVRCGSGDLWIDVETRAILRSRGSSTRSSEPVDGSAHTFEVTELAFGEQPSNLFRIEPPAGVTRMSSEAYGCAVDPVCSASPRPVVTPAPAPVVGEVPADLDALVARTLALEHALPAFEVIVRQWNSRHPSFQVRVAYDGSSRFRMETNDDPIRGEPAQIKLFGDGYLYTTETKDDGSTIWRDLSVHPDALRIYPLQIPGACGSGWRYRGVDLVQGRMADHLMCSGADRWQDFWIDRETHFVVRTQSSLDSTAGIDVYEVLELGLARLPDSVFALPANAVVQGPTDQTQSPAPSAAAAP